MQAEIIVVGSEMLTPYRQDTNSLHLTARLNDLGVTVAFKTIVGDNLEHLTAAARIALSRADIEEKFVLNVQHGGWDKARTQAALKLAGALFNETVDLGVLRG